MTGNTSGVDKAATPHDSWLGRVDSLISDEISAIEDAIVALMVHSEEDYNTARKRMQAAATQRNQEFRDLLFRVETYSRQLSPKLGDAVEQEVRRFQEQRKLKRTAAKQWIEKAKSTRASLPPDVLEAVEKKNWKFVSEALAASGSKIDNEVIRDLEKRIDSLEDERRSMAQLPSILRPTEASQRRDLAQGTPASSGGQASSDNEAAKPPLPRLPPLDPTDAQILKLLNARYPGRLVASAIAKTLRRDSGPIGRNIHTLKGLGLIGNLPRKGYAITDQGRALLEQRT